MHWKYKNVRFSKEHTVIWDNTVKHQGTFPHSSGSLTAYCDWKCARVAHCYSFWFMWVNTESPVNGRRVQNHRKWQNDLTSAEGQCFSGKQYTKGITVVAFLCVGGAVCVACHNSNCQCSLWKPHEALNGVQWFHLTQWRCTRNFCLSTDLTSHRVCTNWAWCKWFRAMWPFENVLQRRKRNKTSTENGTNLKLPESAQEKKRGNQRGAFLIYGLLYTFYLKVLSSREVRPVEKA